MRQIFFCYLFLVLFPKVAVAQITSDNSLGAENSQVNSTSEQTEINGGAIRGENLFHSFNEFNVNEGEVVNFTNPDGIANILSRVTGNNISQILGDLGVLGDANLFLMNHNGIVFGEKASINVNGSFVATTADSILFRNGIEFDASHSNTSPLLTVDIPIGLKFRDNPGAIINQAQSSQKAELNNQFNSNFNPAGLLVQPSQTLALIGGEIILEGGALTASGGNIELGSIGSNSLVSLEVTKSKITFDYQAVENFLDITLTNREGFVLVADKFQKIEIPSTIDAITGETIGSINIWGNKIDILNSSQFLGGNLTISINAFESINLATKSLIENDILEDVNAGNTNTDIFANGGGKNIDITNVCQQTVKSKFVDIGKGGLPKNPNTFLQANNIEVGLVAPILTSEKVLLNRQKNRDTMPERTPTIISRETKKPPAQGWIQRDNALVELIAQNPDRLGEQRNLHNGSNCQ